MVLNNGNGIYLTGAIENGTGNTYAEVAPKISGISEPIWSRSLRFYKNQDAWCIGNSTNKIYHVGFKPTAAEVGASPTSHNHNSLYLGLSGGTMTSQITTPTNGALKDASGKIFLRNNNTGATVLSNENGSIYFRPQGDLISTNEVVISPRGILNAPNLTVNGSAVYHTNRKPTTSDIGAIKAISLNGYWGLTQPDGDVGQYLRTPINGLLPFRSNDGAGNGGSQLGTSSWRFAGLWTTSINGMGVSEGNSSAFNRIAKVGADGVMEVGKYIDFHEASGVLDYSMRLEVGDGNIKIRRAESGSSANWIGFYKEGADVIYGYISNSSQSNDYYHTR